MKILWFTNIPLPVMLGTANQSHAVSGGWMAALLEQLLQIPDMEIAVACAAPGLKASFSKENLSLYSISQGSAWRPFGFKALDDVPHYLAACIEIVREFDPDIIHVHGTERFYGLLGTQGRISPPVVVSLQGLLHDYTRYRHYFGVTPLKDIIAMHDLPHLARWMGPFPEYLHARHAAQRELEILRENHWFFGRTAWDKAHLLAINPGARYFHVPELMRTTFYDHVWDLNACQRHRIIFTNANTFRRGTEVLLDALVILKQDFPAIRLALAGGVERLPYGKRLQRRIAALGLQDAVEFLGQINEEQMVNELKKAHVFTIASLLENSPNSLCEAQLIGMPCVASYVGGIPSLVEEGVTGLFFPAGDAALLAERLREVFKNDNLARELGIQARQIALNRHDRNAVTQTVIETYRAIIQEHWGHLCPEVIAQNARDE